MEIVKIKNTEIVRVKSDDIEIRDAQSALDFVMTVEYQAKTNLIIIDKSIIAEAFFDLKTKLLGEAFQKLLTYNIKLAVIGDFTQYASKSLHDYIVETNKGKDIFFLQTENQAIEWLSKLN